ncbi:unnamed protein product [Lactuca virosa]|uniref:Uncharacterized protein n=1 Tax=Lactuca virosa TaxID=75947 RepID=A0AAU9PI78_9ASTR|nr:unnamed protein product [Lactuca virosa]
MMTTIFPQIFATFTDYKLPRQAFYTTKSRQSTNPFTRRYVCCFHHQNSRLGFESRVKLSLSKHQFDENLTKKKRVVLVRSNNLKFNSSGGGGGGGRDDGSTARVLGNLALAIGLTYLSFTGQLGWVLDAIVSVWLLVILVPIVGLGVLIWWAGKDMVQSNCPNCGNEFQVFESTLTEESQVCPYCSQPFSVVGNEFVRNPVKYPNESTSFGEAFSDFSSRSKKGKASSRPVIDIEAEVKDID